ncbi:Sugar-specific transcriptional regulator TrmB [Microbacterium terrae]|uniref:Sugar-specific transcriptional regulator TrmB n=2 Tax=Microbacterium terrae TaxID=69369 RepID=A0A0M2H2V9_9MICO|nr:Sugar-specific transcriptional regulator TrmB [Microbacterium terrae]
MLSGLGIDGTATDDEVYRFIVGNIGASADDVARAIDRSPKKVLRSIRRLRDLGLISPSRLAPEDGVDSADDPAARWRATAPDAALGPVLRRARRRLHHAEAALYDLVDLYQREHVAESPSDYLELIEGRDAQAHRLRQLQRGARVTIDAFQTGRNAVIDIATAIRAPNLVNPVEAAPADPGESPDGLPPVAFRVVADGDFLTEPEALRALDNRVAMGHEVRIADAPLIKLAIADGNVGMLQVSATTAVVLHRPLVVLGIELFESVWRHARPYEPGTTPLEPADRRLLQLMLAGLTDTAMARQLDISPRTVQRRLRALMDEARVTTRSQLGWHALRSNWV